ncbi:MAG: ferritin-like domain-containing protein [Eubacteriales bacterium]
MILTEKETAEIKSLKMQEEGCVEKYGRHAKQAKDTVLKDLFLNIQKEEQKHCDSLQQVLGGTVPSCNCNDSAGKNYAPTATYSQAENTEDKQNDCYLATDCIGNEKLVSSEYNSGVFVFGDSNVRKLLADIQIEEQNHADMLWKYKTTNGMV